jgi:sorbitol/mannitol transport system substrate-binding protein
MASAVSEDASKASVPAAYPAREGMVTAENSPDYGEAANDSIAGAMPPVVSPTIADITNAIRPILMEVLTGSITVEDGMAQMQAAGEAVAG